MPNTNQNTRQATQNEAGSVRGLTKHNQDYWRLPKALKAIVDAYAALCDAEDQMSEANSIVSTPAGLGPNDAPDDHMLRELSGLVEHTRAELRRHGVIEGALAWLAGHPEGWDDEPDASDQAERSADELSRGCRNCGALLMVAAPGILHCIGCGGYTDVRSPDGPLFSLDMPA